jgi:hypothetical protein
MIDFLSIVARIYVTTCLISQAKDLSFGQRQVEQVICDQPDMGEVINREPELKRALIWWFAGELNGRRIYWDNREPEDSRTVAEHLPAYYLYPAMIRIRRTRATPVDKCVSLAFELNNLEVDREYQKLLTASIKDRKNREEFAKDCVRLEYEAGKRIQVFFQRHPITVANLYFDIDYYSITLQTGTFTDYLHWLETLDDKEHLNTLVYYRSAYDALVPPSTEGSNSK